MVPIRADGLKFVEALFPGKFGICGLIKPLIIVERLSVLCLLVDDLLIYLYFIILMIYFSSIFEVGK